MNWQDLLEESRDGANPDPALRARVRHRLTIDLPAAGLATPIQPVVTRPRAAAPAVSARGYLLRKAGKGGPWASKVLLVAAGMGAGFGLGRATVADRLTPSAPPISVPARDAAANLPARASDTTVADDDGAPAAEAAVDPTGVRADVLPRLPNAPRGARRRAGSVDADRLREALGLLQRAHAALRDGHPGAARAWLAQLDERVPTSVLTEERAVTLVLAWCDSGEARRARDVARHLFARNPGSVYARRLADSCVGRQAPPPQGPPDDPK